MNENHDKPCTLYHYQYFIKPCYHLSQIKFILNSDVTTVLERASKTTVTTIGT